MVINNIWLKIFLLYTDNLAELYHSPKFGTEPLHAAVVHHCVLLQEGEFLILHLRVFPLEKKARFVL